MISPRHKAELAQFLRQLADAIEGGETTFKTFRVTSTTEHQILPGGEIARDACTMAADLTLMVESTADYQRFERARALAHNIEDVAFNAGLRNRYR